MKKTVSNRTLSPEQAKVASANIAKSTITKAQRQELKHKLSSASIKLRDPGKFEAGKSSYRLDFSEGGAAQHTNRPSIFSLKKERDANIKKQRKGKIQFGLHNNFQTLALTESFDGLERIPERFQVPTRQKLKAQGQKHNYFVGFRDGGDHLGQARQSYERELRDLQSQRGAFVRKAKDLQLKARQSSLPAGRTPVKRRTESLLVETRADMAEEYFKRPGKHSIYQIYGVAPKHVKLKKIDRFGKKMMSPAQTSIKLGHIEGSVVSSPPHKRTVSKGDLRASIQSNSNSKQNISPPKGHAESFSRYEKMRLDRGNLQYALPALNHVQIKEINQANHLPFKDRYYQTPSHGVANQTHLDASASHGVAKLPAIRRPLVRSNIPLQVDKKDVGAFRKAGAYHSIFTEQSANIDNASTMEKKRQFKLSQMQQKEHHKIALLDKDYRDIYNMTTRDRPQNNPMIPQTQSPTTKVGASYYAQKLEMMNNRTKQGGVQRLLS